MAPRRGSTPTTGAAMSSLHFATRSRPKTTGTLLSARLNIWGEEQSLAEEKGKARRRGGCVHWVRMGPRHESGRQWTQLATWRSLGAQGWATGRAAVDAYPVLGAALMVAVPVAGLWVGRGVWRGFNRITEVSQLGFKTSPRFGRNRLLAGRVMSVGDGDGFRFYHRPWGLRWLPDRKGPTLSIRLAGVDAPETAQ